MRCFQEIIAKLIQETIQSLGKGNFKFYHSIYWPQEMPQIDMCILR